MRKTITRKISRIVNAVGKGKFVFLALGLTAIVFLTFNVKVADTNALNSIRSIISGNTKSLINDAEYKVLKGLDDFETATFKAATVNAAGVSVDSTKTLSKLIDTDGTLATAEAETPLELGDTVPGSIIAHGYRIENVGQTDLKIVPSMLTKHTNPLEDPGHPYHAYADKLGQDTVRKNVNTALYISKSDGGYELISDEARTLDEFDLSEFTNDSDPATKIKLAADKEITVKKGESVDVVLVHQRIDNPLDMDDYQGNYEGDDNKGQGSIDTVRFITYYTAQKPVTTP